MNFFCILFYCLFSFFINASDSKLTCSNYFEPFRLPSAKKLKVIMYNGNHGVFYLVNNLKLHKKLANRQMSIHEFRQAINEAMDEYYQFIIPNHRGKEKYMRQSLNNDACFITQYMDEFRNKKIKQ